MEIRLAYGKSGLQLNIPDHIHAEVVEPRYVEGLPDQKAALARALAHPIQMPPLKESVDSNQKVAIVFSDITRATPYHILIPALLEALDHLPDEHIAFFCATGTHRQASREELITILGEEVVQRFRIVQNNAGDVSLFSHVGDTASGNAIRLNSDILEYDLRILTGFIEPHFFAGFSGGGKALMPGMAHVESICFNHSIRNLEHPKARWGQTNGNPLWKRLRKHPEIRTGCEFAHGLH